MGWGRMLLLGDLGQQMDIQDTQAELARLKAAVSASRAGAPRQADQAIAQLQDELGEIKLYLAALVRMLISAGVVTREEFATIVESVDGSDGSADGRYRGSVM